jgi:hypothetical protein
MALCSFIETHIFSRFPVTFFDKNLSQTSDATMTIIRKKLIEVALPLDAINAAAAREKSIRHGHPSTLHLWWARRPLAAARAVIFAQMVDDPLGEPRPLPDGRRRRRRSGKRLFRIIEDLVAWENTTNETVLQRARDEIWQSWRRTCAAKRGPSARQGAVRSQEAARLPRPLRRRRRVATWRRSGWGWRPTPAT